MTNQDKYFGDWVNDKFDGQGIYILKCGERYEGLFSQGEKSRKSGYYSVNGNIYYSEWANCKKNGYGVQNYCRIGEKYEGDWRNGQKHGQGSYTYASGDLYTGSWVAGEQAKQGVSKIKKGMVFKFKNPLKQDMGKRYKNIQKTRGTEPSQNGGDP